MKRPHAVTRVTPDRAALICYQCSDKKDAEEWAINNDYEIRSDICANHSVQMVNQVTAHVEATNQPTNQQRKDAVNLFQGWIDKNK